MIHLDGKKVDQNHPAIQTLAAIIEQKTSHLKDADIVPLLGLLDYLDPNHKNYSPELAGVFDQSLFYAKLAHKIDGGKESREVDSSLKISEESQEELLSRLIDVYKNHSKTNEELRQKGIFPNFELEYHLSRAGQGMIDVRYEKAIQTWAALARGDTEQITAKQIKGFMDLLDRLDPLNEKYDSTLAEFLNKNIEEWIGTINQRYKDKDPNPTFNFDLPTQTQLLDRLARFTRYQNQGLIDPESNKALYDNLRSALQGVVNVGKAMQQRQHENKARRTDTGEKRTGEGEVRDERIEEDKPGEHRREDSKTSRNGSKIRRLLGRGESDGKHRGWRSRIAEIANRGRDLLTRPFVRQGRTRQEAPQNEMGERSP